MDAILRQELLRLYIDFALARHADDSALLVITEEPEESYGFIRHWWRRDVDDKHEVSAVASSLVSFYPDDSAFTD